MIRHFLMAGLVPASFCMANPIAYSEGGCNVAAMGTYARYGIEQHFNGFALDTALNFNLSLVDVQSVSFSTGIYKNFGSWRLGPEFTTGLAAVGWEKPFVYTSYAVRGMVDITDTWSITQSIGFQPIPRHIRQGHDIHAWPVLSCGLQRRF